MAIVFGILSLFFLGGGTVVVTSPHITPLCKVLDNCAKDAQYQKVFEDGTNTGELARSLEETPQNLNDLHTSQDRYSKAIEKLETIPEDVKVYPEAEKQLANYRQSLAQLESRIEAEENAEKQLKYVEEIVREANRPLQNTLIRVL